MSEPTGQWPVNVLLLGDFTDAPWHPLEPARAALQSILEPAFRITATENYDELSRLNPADYPLCISYTDCWNRKPAPEQTAGLLRYVAGGGGLLVIHNGISLQAGDALAQLIGARFTGHPPYQPLRYVPIGEHPVLGGVDPFDLDEEPYAFELDPLAERTAFLAYEFEGAQHPAGWERSYGLGRVVYVQPGHHAPSFEPASYRRLVLNAAHWACGGK
ncbi:ThuA domain-containing protein [Paenibacillus sacheonensis]|uniref:ThuA domain-containing protein n=1 Tax=Paenibacillus sacheonensis TaxID=742054 RepID=A0A7X5BZ66_9BACL|nr:ThuA domain-containing protein [Paenibacillus sacheonensis]MBM7565060.1 type 1 glutamine amidotransferase [Paenibacillus sacheonensis]NBC70156.1 ThuA domain-containing protein [Paenibacillus sacheonensis]